MKIANGLATGPKTSYITSRLTAMNNLLPMQVLQTNSISIYAGENNDANSGSSTYNDSSDELIKNEACFILC